MQYTTLRPGLLISLKSSVTGNVTYSRRDLDSSVTSSGEELARWETERTIRDKAEYEAAIKIRGRCRTLIAATCSASRAFGLLCPDERVSEFEAALAEAQAIAAEFNATASVTRVSVFVMTGRIAPDDVQAVRAINSEIRDLLAEMDAGLRKFDVEQIREAANRARALGAMLSPDAASRVKSAIEAARSAARRIVKAGEAAAVEVDRVALRTIAASRTAFLDLDQGEELAAPAETGRAVDFATEAPIPAAVAAAVPTSPAPVARNIEL